MIITIDGPSGTGKSSVAKMLARRLGISFFDTGALYRVLAWQALEEGVVIDDLDRLKKLLKEFSFGMEETKEGRRYFSGSVDVTDRIRSPEVSEAASHISAIGEVRAALLTYQRRYGENHDAVFEGRDLGTVVFPLAEIKIFLTADSLIRAQRRYKELLGKNSSVQPEEVLEAMKKRDAQDAEREIAPLCCPEGAFVLDTSLLSQEQVVDAVIDYIEKRKEP